MKYHRHFEVRVKSTFNHVLYERLSTIAIQIIMFIFDGRVVPIGNQRRVLYVNNNSKLKAVPVGV